MTAPRSSTRRRRDRCGWLAATCLSIGCAATEPEPLSPPPPSAAAGAAPITDDMQWHAVVVPGLERMALEVPLPRHWRATVAPQRSPAPPVRALAHFDDGRSGEPARFVVFAAILPAAVTPSDWLAATARRQRWRMSPSDAPHPVARGVWAAEAHDASQRLHLTARRFGRLMLATVAAAPRGNWLVVQAALTHAGCALRLRQPMRAPPPGRMFEDPALGELRFPVPDGWRIEPRLRTRTHTVIDLRLQTGETLLGLIRVRVMARPPQLPDMADIVGLERDAWHRSGAILDPAGGVDPIAPPRFAERAWQSETTMVWGDMPGAVTIRIAATPARLVTVGAWHVKGPPTLPGPMLTRGALDTLWDGIIRAGGG